MAGITTGFNSNNIATQMQNISKAMDSISTALADDLKSSLVVKEADYWACQDAIDFFTKLSSELSKLVDTDIKNNFESVFKTFNSCAGGWAQETGNASAWTAQKLSYTSRKLDTSAIQENLNGNRGINKSKATSIAESSFKTAVSSVQKAISSAQRAIDNAGFIDEKKAQMNAAKNLLSALSTAVQNQVSGFKDSMIEAMGQSADKYGELATTVSSTLDSGN